jgi:hypothetical protein
MGTRIEDIPKYIDKDCPLHKKRDKNNNEVQSVYTTMGDQLIAYSRLYEITMDELRSKL